MHTLRILTTGSNGLLGQKLTSLLLHTEDTYLIATGQGENRFPVTVGYIYEELDITDHNRVREVIEKYKPDVVINAAAMTNVDACESQPDHCKALNVDAVENIAKICGENDIHLIHISTDFIFDGKRSKYTETDEPNPLSVYGQSKWDGEKMVMQYAKKWAILRTVLVYGVVDDRSRSNIVMWAYQMLKNKSSARVVDDQFRTPTLTEDLAKGCLLAAQKQAQGIYNISGKDYMSILELVQRVADFFGFDASHVAKVKSEDLNQPAKRPPTTGLDISKARKELGYEPHSFEEGLELVKMQLG